MPMKKPLKKSIALLMLMLLVNFAVTAYADENIKSSRTVRVGYGNYPGFLEDSEDGEIIGYAAEYLSDIRDYTDWELQFVCVPWNEQLNMLKNGELDIIIGQYSEERLSEFSINHIPICILPSLLYIRADADAGAYTIPEGINGRKIGVIKGSGNIELLADYAEIMGFTFKPMEFDMVADMETALMSGEIDLIAAEHMTGRPMLRAVERFSLLPYHFYALKDNNGLLNELNFVLDKINGVNPDYQPKLFQKYYKSALADEKPYFTEDEEAFIKSCGEITLTHIPDSRPGAYHDYDGQIVGIVPDIMNMISELSGLKFKHVITPNEMTPLQYIRENPDYLACGVSSNNLAFQSPDVIISDTYYMTYSAIAVRSEKAKDIDISAGEYTIGTSSFFQAMQLYLSDKYPNLTIKTDYLTVAEGLQALASGKIDMFAHDLNMMMPDLGSPRLGNLTIIENRFMPSPLCNAAIVSDRNRKLVEIIDKCIAVIPREKINQIEEKHLRANVYEYSSKDVLYRYRHDILKIGTGILVMFAILISALWIHQRKYTKLVTHQAQRDLMTGLFNRETARAEIERWLTLNKETPCSFLIIDIDDLKGINDQLGHAVGDEAIKGMAAVLIKQFRATDIIGRIGGDEFMVFLVGTGTKEVVVPILERLVSAISSISLADGKRYLKGSIGVSTGMAGETDIETFYRRADEALYTVKRGGKNGFAFFDKA